MRQWLLPPECLCKKHLLGEHVEHHMFVGAINKNKNIQGYIDKGLLNPYLLKQRHDDLVVELKKRSYNHNSPLQNFKPLKNKQPCIDIERNFKELANRCEDCHARIKKYFDRQQYK